MKPRPVQKTEKDPEALLRAAIKLANCAPRAGDVEIEAAIRAYGECLLRADRAKRIA